MLVLGIIVKRKVPPFSSPFFYGRTLFYFYL